MELIDIIDIVIIEEKSIGWFIIQYNRDIHYTYIILLVFDPRDIRNESLCCQMHISEEQKDSVSKLCHNALSTPDRI